MAAKRIQRKITRTPEEQRQLEEIRRRFQQEQPTLAELLSSGDATEVVSQREYVDLCRMLAALKQHREKQGLSLADVAERSGIDRAAISRLENGAHLNPTVDTLYRYAEAVGAQIAFQVRTAG